MGCERTQTAANATGGDAIPSSVYRCCGDAVHASSGMCTTASTSIGSNELNQISCLNIEVPQQPAPSAGPRALGRIVGPPQGPPALRSRPGRWSCPAVKTRPGLGDQVSPRPEQSAAWRGRTGAGERGRAGRSGDGTVSGEAHGQFALHMTNLSHCTPCCTYHTRHEQTLITSLLVDKLILRVGY